MSDLKVVTVTLNPALDLTGSMDQLVPGSVSLVNSSTLHAAGKGVNVAKVLSDLGADVTVTGFLGTDNQEMFCQLFEEIGATDRFVRIHGATRINVKLVENSGRVNDINFPGIQVNDEALTSLENTLFELAETHDFFVLAGSLPPGVSPEKCAQWVEALRQRGKKVLFDSSRAALKAGIDARPWLIKPNEEELGELLGQKLDDQQACLKAAASLAEKGIENIVVSMGAEGVMWCHEGEWLHSCPPKMEVVSTVGAGDTLVAGLCWGHMQAWNRKQILSFATALSALAVSQVGVGASDIKEVESLQSMIEIQELASSHAI